MAADGERSPLLSEPIDGGAGGNGLVGPGGSGAGPGGGLTPSAPPYGAAFPPFPEGHPAVLPGEDPPPYSPLTSPDSGSAPMITCRVCQSLINVEGKMHQHVVKCGVCNEATFGTWKHARRYGGIYAAWAFVILLAVLCLGRALYWACMKVSHPVQNFS
ncbi:hypothetical protein G4228_009309 [Cervus hanglu yarkandensis]|nr:hypothetical protein G4228_009309 [Cervus hanglu yarkandensis]